MGGQNVSCDFGRGKRTLDRSRFLGRGCDEALFSEKKRVFTDKGGGIQ